MRAIGCEAVNFSIQRLYNETYITIDEADDKIGSTINIQLFDC